jgi:undecaprenyl diphosphate synthase
MQNNPEHIFITLDGCHKWAENNNLSVLEAYKKAFCSLKDVVSGCKELDINCLTAVLVDSKEETIGLLIDFLEEILKEFCDVKYSVVMDSRLCGNDKEKIDKLVESTKDNKGLNLIIALDYNGKQEILDAVNNIIQDYKENKIKIKDINNDMFNNYLYSKNLPEPDLVIRTDNNKNMKNLCLWQVAYSELYILEKLWPDFGKQDFFKAIESFGTRERRFGNIGEKK